MTVICLHLWFLYKKGELRLSRQSLRLRRLSLRAAFCDLAMFSYPGREWMIYGLYSALSDQDWATFTEAPQNWSFMPESVHHSKLFFWFLFNPSIILNFCPFTKFSDSKFFSRCVNHEMCAVNLSMCVDSSTDTKEKGDLKKTNYSGLVVQENSLWHLPK